MSPVMLAHVYLLLGHCSSLERGLDHIFRRAHEGDYCAVGGLSRVHVKNLYTSYRGDCSHDGVYDGFVAPLTEIRNAFYDSTHWLIVFSKIVKKTITYLEKYDKRARW